MIKFSLLAACALVLGAPAIAGDETTTVPASDAPAPKEKMVCKRERELGSNLTTKVCQTEAQWRAQREADKHNVNERDRSDR